MEHQERCGLRECLILPTQLSFELLDASRIARPGGGPYSTTRTLLLALCPNSSGMYIASASAGGKLNCPRLVDLSRAAALKLGYIKRGLTKVKVELL